MRLAQLILSFEQSQDIRHHAKHLLKLHVCVIKCVQHHIIPNNNYYCFVIYLIYTVIETWWLSAEQVSHM